MESTVSIADFARLEQRVEQLEVQFEKENQLNMGAHKEFYGRFDAINKFQATIDVRYDTLIQSINSLEKTLQKLEQGIKNEVEQIRKQVSEIKARPGKWMDHAIMAGIAAIVAFIIAQVLK